MRRLRHGRSGRSWCYRRGAVDLQQIARTPCPRGAAGLARSAETAERRLRRARRVARMIAPRIGIRATLTSLPVITSTTPRATADSRPGHPTEWASRRPDGAGQQIAILDRATMKIPPPRRMAMPRQQTEKPPGIPPATLLLRSFFCCSLYSVLIAPRRLRMKTYGISLNAPAGQSVTWLERLHQLPMGLMYIYLVTSGFVQ